MILLAWIEALRPKQWTKNLLVFAGLVFAQHLNEWPLVVRAIAGFVAFSLLAGSVYVINDLRDLEADRQHSRKKKRPIPSGRLPVAFAWAALVPTLAVAGVLAWWLGKGFVLTALVYLVVNAAYSYGLKHQVVLDVFLIAIGFVLRAIAGVQLLMPVTSTELSPWLLVCTFFGALFLALAKRRREIVNAGGNAALQREVLDAYTPETLDGMLLISASASVMGYALYTIWPATVAKFHTEAMLYTVPFVAYGIFRYLYLVRVADTTEDPSQVLLTDRPLALCIGLYLATVIAVLYRVP